VEYTCDTYPMNGRKSAKFPVNFPVTREIGSGERFALDSQHRHLLMSLARSPVLKPPPDLVKSPIHGIPHALLGHDLSKSLVDAAGSGVFLRKLLKIGIGPLQRS